MLDVTGLRCLVVAPDSRETADLLSALRGLGASGQVLVTVDAATTTLARCNSDLVLVDVSGANGEGLRLIEWIAQNRPEVSTLALVPSYPLDHIADAARHGAHGFLVKPASLDAVAFEIHKTLTRRRAIFDQMQSRAISPFMELRGILTGASDCETILRRIVETVGIELRADRASLVCLDEESGDVATASVASGGSEAHLSPAAGRSHYWRLSAAQIAAASDDDLSREDHDYFLTAPVETTGGVVGVLIVIRESTRHPFTKIERDILSLLAAQCAVALRNSFLFKQVRQMHLNMIRAFARAAELRDHPLTGHSDRIAAYSCAIGRRYGLDRIRLDSLQIAGRLHDIGKIGVSDAILLKPGPLTFEEFEAMKQHTRMGAELLSAAGFAPPVVEAVLYHHERYDGTGYPLGLAGEAIPLEARILAVADAFEVMTSGRHYRAAVELGQALTDLRAHSGSQFDPHVVDALLEAIGSGELILSQAAVSHPCILTALVQGGTRHG